MLRGSGLFWDLRKIQPYEIYSTLNFRVPFGKNGDCYDRYLVRIQEMRESLKIINSSIALIASGQTRISNEKVVPPARILFKSDMESLIHHFKMASESTILPSGEFYISVEAPKGEFGLYLSASDHSYLDRIKIRAPGFYHLQGLKCMAPLHLLADVVTIIGTQDIVFGEVDR